MLTLRINILDKISVMEHLQPYKRVNRPYLIAIILYNLKIYMIGRDACRSVAIDERSVFFLPDLFVSGEINLQVIEVIIIPSVQIPPVFNSVKRVKYVVAFSSTELLNT